MPSQIRVVVQVKNTREWYYPNSETVWQLLASAVQLDAIPVLIARRVAEPSFLFADDAGAFLVPSFNTYIHQDAQASPDWTAFDEACTNLGYKDVKLINPERPEERHVTLWTKLAARLPEMKATFDPHRKEVLRLAVDEGLQDDIRTTYLSEQTRDNAFHEFWSSIRPELDSPTHPRLF